MQALTIAKNKYDARKLKSSEQALLRQMAVSRVISGEPVSRVTQAYGLGDKTLYKWLRIYKNEGATELAKTATQGRRRQLSAAQLAVVFTWMTSSPVKMWSRKALLERIKLEFGVSCSATTLGRLLGACGLNAPKLEGKLQTYIAGQWQMHEKSHVQELVRRKRAERINLAFVRLRNPVSAAVWEGWAAFGARGGVMLLGKEDLLSALKSINEQATSSQVVMVDIPLPTSSVWCSELAMLKHMTLVCVNPASNEA